jgi:hypothetical protein
MSLEVVIVGVTLASLLSELRDEQLSGAQRLDPQRREIVMTSASLALTVIAFGVTLLGAGDAISGLKLAGERISAAGNAVVSRFIGSTGYVTSQNHTSERNDRPSVQALSQNESQSVTAVFGEDGDREGR